MKRFFRGFDIFAGRKGFTLVELMVGMLIMSILGIAVMQILSGGLLLWGRSANHSVAIAGGRYSIAMVPDSLSLSAVSIEILQDPVIPSSVASNEHYIYAEDGQMVHLDSSGKTHFIGSEAVAGVRFSIPVAMTKDVPNYMLSIDVTTAQGQTGELGSVSMDMSKSISLLALAHKSPSNTRSDIYSGNVLRYCTALTQFRVENLKIRDSSDRTILNGLSRNNGVGLEADYDVTLPEGKTNMSTAEWYISGSTSAKTSSDAAISTASRNSGLWLIVDSNNKPLIEHHIPISGDIFVRVKDGGSTKAIRWGRYGIVRYFIFPKCGFSEPDMWLDPMLSPYVEIRVISPNEPDDGFWNKEWHPGLTGNDVPTVKPGEQINPQKDSSVNSIIDPETGERIVTLHTDSKNFGSSIVKRVRFDHLRGARAWERKKIGDNRSPFTTLTNYSLIVDMKIKGSLSGYGFLINGSMTVTSKDADGKDVWRDTGYMFQYDKYASSLLMRGFVAGDQQSIMNVRGTAEGSVFYNIPRFFVRSSPRSVGIVGNRAMTPFSTEYGMYHPKHLQNSIYKFPGDSTKDNNQWLVRTRMQYTILEYYKNNDPTKPHFIVRIKFLKNPEEVSPDIDKDPFSVGVRYVNSEPMWLGGFDGVKAGTTEITSGDLKGILCKNLPVRNITEYDGTSFDTVISRDNKGNQLYILKYKDDELAAEGFPKDGLFYSIFRGYNMNFIDDFRFTSTAHQEAKLIMSKANRERFTGIRMWGGDTSAHSEIYSIRIGPGFSGEELNAILSSDAKLYNVWETTEGFDKNETYPECDYYPEFDDDKDATDKMHLLPKHADGVMGIQYPFYVPYYMQQ